MNDSILLTLKQGLGIPKDDDAFDPELVVHANAALMVLADLGVGPPNGFFISGASETWAQFIGGREDFEMVKSYLILKVKLLFDPPSSSSVMESTKALIAEWEWRLNVRAEGAYEN